MLVVVEFIPICGSGLSSDRKVIFCFLGGGLLVSLSLPLLLSL